MPLLSGKIALVTGGTSGIGEAIATSLASQGARVVLLARNPERIRATTAKIRAASPEATVDAIETDLASQSSIRRAVAAFGTLSPRLDIFVGAAGVFHRQRTETEDRVESTFAVNYLSNFLLANLLEPALRRGAPSRVVFVASPYGRVTIDFDDLMITRRKFTVMNSVAPTKLAEILLAQELSRRWSDAGISVNAMHPGLVAHTRLLGEVGGMWRWITNTFGGTPERGADTAVWLASSPEAAGLTGQFVSRRKVRPTPGQGSDQAARARLWDESARLTGIEGTPRTTAGG